MVNEIDEYFTLPGRSLRDSLGGAHRSDAGGYVSDLVPRKSHGDSQNAQWAPRREGGLECSTVL
jgi:hypothetical protein